MPTTAEYLARLVQAKTDIATAITNKGGTVNSGDGLEEFPADIATIPTGGGGEGVGEKDVNFYDYDGTLLHSYTAQEFLALTEMPANPDRTSEGLKAQGWNWSLSDAKDYVTDFGILQIGQMYVTTDGKTRIKVVIGYPNGIYKIGLYLGSFTGTVDWGDGTVESYSNSISHTYPTENHIYTITLEATSGKIQFMGRANGYSESSSSFAYKCRAVFNPDASTWTAADLPHLIQDIQLGNNVEIQDGAFSSIGSSFSIFSKINLPNNLTITSSKFLFAFSYINAIILPNTFTNLGRCIIRGSSGTKSHVSVLSIPNSVTSIGSNIDSGNHNILIYYNDQDLTLNIPKNVTTFLGYFGNNGNRFNKISLPNTISTLYDASGNITNYITLNGTTTKELIINGTNTYNITYQITYVTEIPNISTSITTMPSFERCMFLKSVTIPSNITDLPNNMFMYTYNFEYIKFEGTTPPTATSSTFSGLYTNCIIYVPALVSNLYMTGTDYPNPSKYNYIGYATYNNGDTLPTLTTDETYTLTWYATVDDAIAQTNPITQGNGNEVYSRATAVV